MRLATKEEEFLPLLKQAQQEAEAAFGNGAVYIERYVQNPRHIEFQVGLGLELGEEGAIKRQVWRCRIWFHCCCRPPSIHPPTHPSTHPSTQVLADKYGNVVHLGERDCSVQRRNQKLIEEAPSPALTPEVGGGPEASGGALGVRVWGCLLLQLRGEQMLGLPSARSLMTSVVALLMRTLDSHDRATTPVVSPHLPPPTPPSPNPDPLKHIPPLQHLIHNPYTQPNPNPTTTTPQPSPPQPQLNHPPQVRKQMGEAAVNAARAIGYVGVGTIEFLWEKKGFYFMEMNTRIQARRGWGILGGGGGAGARPCVAGSLGRLWAFVVF